MELEGRLNPALSLPEVLQFLGMGKMTGTLTIHHGNYSASLVLRQGKLVNSSSFGKPRRLGQMLLNRGLIERSAIEDALTFQKQNAPGSPLGQILVQRGHISTEQLRQAIRLQLEEELWDLFSLTEGSFKFEHAADSALGEALIEMDIEPLIIEGTRRLDEWQRIVKNIPQGEAAVPGIAGDGTNLDREVMTLSDGEWRVLSLVNGFYDAGSIATRSGIGKFETFRILNSFLASGYVAFLENGDREMPPDTPSDIARPPTPMMDRELDSGVAPAVGNGRSGFSATASTLSRGKSAMSKFGSNVTPAPERTQFYTPVGFLAALANALTEKLMSTSEFSAGAADQKLAEQYWRGIVMQYPRADMLEPHGTRLDATYFERFAELAGSDKPLRNLMDDTMEALGRYLKMVFLLTAQRLGMKAAQGMVPKYAEDFRNRSTIEFDDNFRFQEFFSTKVYAQS